MSQKQSKQAAALNSSQDTFHLLTVIVLHWHKTKTQNRQPIPLSLPDPLRSRPEGPSTAADIWLFSVRVWWGM